MILAARAEDSNFDRPNRGVLGRPGRATVSKVAICFKGMGGEIARGVANSSGAAFLTSFLTRRHGEFDAGIGTTDAHRFTPIKSEFE